MKTLGVYKNGNYRVVLLSDGTKVRETEENEFIPTFAENCDCKISNRCDGACSWCYEGCIPNGKHGDILNYKFLDTLHPYTELAINGNDMSHPNLISFLKKLQEKRVVANMTINQIHFEKYYNYIQSLIEDQLIYGLGVSLKNPTKEFVARVKTIPNAVIHVINGIFDATDWKVLGGNDLKILILGYKNLRRGNDYYNSNEDRIKEEMHWLYGELEYLIKDFKVVSFDNLAIEQLDVKRLLSEEQWNKFYMGDDGKYTFFLDLVEGTFGKNSLATKRYPILDNIDEMFQKILNANN